MSNVEPKTGPKRRRSDRFETLRPDTGRLRGPGSRPPWRCRACRRFRTGAEKLLAGYRIYHSNTERFEVRAPTEFLSALKSHPPIR